MNARKNPLIGTVQVQQRRQVNDKHEVLVTHPSLWATLGRPFRFRYFAQMKNTPFATEAAILDLVNGFRERTLPKEQWTHEAHLVTALWYHVNHSPEESICYLRSGIISYNLSVGGQNTP